MSNLPPPKTRKEKTEFYRALAQEYLDGDKSLCEICTPYTKKTDFIPDRRTIWRHIKQIRQTNNP